VVGTGLNHSEITIENCEQTGDLQHYHQCDRSAANQLSISIVHTHPAVHIWAETSKNKILRANSQCSAFARAQ